MPARPPANVGAAVGPQELDRCTIRSIAARPTPSRAGAYGLSSAQATLTVGAARPERRHLGNLIQDGSTLNVNGSPSRSRPRTTPTGSATPPRCQRRRRRPTATATRRSTCRRHRRRRAERHQSRYRRSDHGAADADATLATANGQTKSSINSAVRCRSRPARRRSQQSSARQRALRRSATTPAPARRPRSPRLAPRRRRPLRPDLDLRRDRRRYGVNVTFGDGPAAGRDPRPAQCRAAGQQPAGDARLAGKMTISTTNDAASSTLGSVRGAIGGTLPPRSRFTAAHPPPVEDAAAQLTRCNLVNQYNSIIQQITTTSQDASFNGVNLLAAISSSWRSTKPASRRSPSPA